jgi:hypothetical protein
MVALRSTGGLVLGVLISLAYTASVQATVSYAPPISITAEYFPEFIAKGDLNGDGHVDLVSVNDNA